MSPSPSQVQQKIAERKQRWVNLYKPENKGARVFMIRYMPELPERPWPRMDNLQERIEWAWQKYQLQCEQISWLDDDSLPYLEVYTGTEIFAAAFGCKTYYPEMDMPFAMPLIHTAEEVASVQIPSLDHAAIASLFQIADELKRRAPEALLHMIDIQSPMDISALIWEKVYFYPAMLQNPVEVQQLSSKVKQYLTSVMDEWFRRYGREFIAHYPDYYMPYGLTLSEDEAGAVSGKVFDRLFLPELDELSTHFNLFGMHCCANARHQWKNFLEIPNFAILNLVQPPEVVREAWSFFADKVVQWHSYQGEGPAYTWLAQHPPQARMVYEITVNSKEEAIEMSARMREVLKP